jgi:sugar-specific transcriptional regulator TrmB
MNVIEDRLDRRLAKTEADVVELKDKVDFCVQTQTPPLQGVFYEGQLWDACSLVEKLIGRAKKEIVLIDSWVGPGTLDMLAKKRKGVSVEVVTSPRGNKLAASDIAKFNAQYGGLSVKTSMAFHDRFLIIDSKELYLIGASLKDLGRKCFGFTVLDKSNIPDIIAKI